jgi:copper oxidase (laccase) domain-containing protein
MLIINPFIFKRFPEIIFGFSTKIGPDAKLPYYFNLSYSVDDVKEIVDSNKKLFFRELGLHEKMVSYQKQVHEDKINSKFFLEAVVKVMLLLRQRKILDWL